MAKGSLLRKRYTSQFCTKYYPFLLKDYTQSGCSKNHILAATTIVKIVPSKFTDPFFVQFNSTHFP